MKKKAFSLTELSIVAVIVGTLVAGVTQGSSLVRTSRLANARAITSKSVVPEISGLVAWYETSLLNSFREINSVDGSEINKWYDTSPSSIVAKKNTLLRTASSAVTLKLNGINELPSIQFSGANDANFSLTYFYQGASAQSTIFMVMRPLADMLATNILDSSSGNSASNIALYSNKIFLNCGTGSFTGIGSNAASISAGGSYVLAAYFNGSSSQAFLNNATTSAGASVIDTGTNPLTGLTIGSERNGSSAFNGLISEIIIYNRPLKLQERKDVMRYLSKKYRIAVTGI